MKAKTPDASMLAIEFDQPEQVEPQPHVFIRRYNEYHELKSCPTNPNPSIE